MDNTQISDASDQHQERLLTTLERLISDLLDVARLNQGLFSLNSQPMDLVELVQEITPAFNTPERPVEVRTVRGCSFSRSR